MARKKIALIGAGNIGGTMALVLAQKQLGDVMLIDIAEGVPQGKALDVMESRLPMNIAAVIAGSNSYDDLAGSDVVIVTAGVPRKPGQTRNDLIGINLPIIKQVGEAIKTKAPNAFVIVVTNPLDAMVYAMQKITGFAKEKVVGMAGVLDSSRLACFVAMELGVSADDVQATVLGGHGPDMVSLYNSVSVGGIPLPQLMDKETFAKISKRTADAGTEIVQLLKTSAFCSPAICSVRMAEAYLLDKKSVLTCAAKLDGEFGIKGGLYCGVPVVMGAGGVEKIIEIEMTEEEKAAFAKSVASVKEQCDFVDTQIK